MSATTPIPQTMAQAVIAPVMMGNCANLILFGSSLSVFFRHLSSYSWTRSPYVLKLTTFFVMGLATFMAALDLHDIWHYSTLADRGLVTVIRGTLVECFKPVILGVLGVAVQGVLVNRTSKAIPSALWRASYLLLFGGLMALELFGAAAATAWSVHFHRSLSFRDWFGLKFSSCIAFWMWSAALTDLTISAIYLFSIWTNLKGSSEIVDNVMKLIIRLTLQSALPTTVIALAAAMLTQIVGNKSIYTELVPYALWNALPSLYALSLFTTLSIAEKGNSSAQIWTSDVEATDLSRHSHSRSHGVLGGIAGLGGVLRFNATTSHIGGGGGGGGSGDASVGQDIMSSPDISGRCDTVPIPLFFPKEGSAEISVKQKGACTCNCGASDVGDVEREERQN